MAAMFCTICSVCPMLMSVSEISVGWCDSLRSTDRWLNTGDANDSSSWSLCRGSGEA